jgi:hypothetical protein
MSRADTDATFPHSYIRKVKDSFQSVSRELETWESQKIDESSFLSERGQLWRFADLRSPSFNKTSAKKIKKMKNTKTPFFPKT